MVSPTSTSWPASVLMNPTRLDSSPVLNWRKKDAGIDAFGIIRVGYFTAEHEYDEAIMRAQETACGSDADFIMLTRITAEMSLDPAWLNPRAAGHYNNRAMTEIGNRAGFALAQYEKGRI